MNNVTVAKLIIAAFHGARAQFPELNKQWIEVSLKVMKYLPQSILLASVQKVGELDLVIRSMEDQQAQDQKDQTVSDAFLGHYLMLLSQIWVASTYEIVRLLHERNKDFGEDFQRLYREFTLVRVPLEKHEIASERKLTEPIQLVRCPSKDDKTDIYNYSKDDEKRSVILPMGVSARGSAMWNAPDIKTQMSVWIERRTLSERFLDILGSV